MLESLIRPLRAALGAAERELTHSPLVHTEEEILDTVRALHRATESIEHHVAVIESLATSIQPLTDSVNNLTATMSQLVSDLGPLAGAEREVKEVEHGIKGLFSRRHD